MFSVKAGVAAIAVLVMLLLKLVILISIHNRNDNATIILIDAFHITRTSTLIVRVANGVVIAVVVTVAPGSVSWFLL